MTSVVLRRVRNCLSIIIIIVISSGSGITEEACVSGNVFYMMEYRETFLLLLKHFDETRQSRYIHVALCSSTAAG